MTPREKAIDVYETWGHTGGLRTQTLLPEHMRASIQTQADLLRWMADQNRGAVV